MSAVENFFANAFGGNPLLATFLISLIPVIEFRGAIPFGVSAKIWGSSALNRWQAFGVALAGNFLVTAVILALLIPVFKLLKKLKIFARLIDYFEHRFKKGATKLKNRKKFWGLFLFTAIPLPLTGVWTASAIAVFLRMNYFISLLAISLGAAAGGLLMVGIALLFGEQALTVFYFFAFAFAVIVTAIIVIALFRKMKKTPAEMQGSQM